MKILLGLHEKIEEWTESLEASSDRPRLPLRFCLSSGFIKRGHSISAISFSSNPGNRFFHRVYGKCQIPEALRDTDSALLWAWDAIGVLCGPYSFFSASRRVILCSYVWFPKKAPLRVRLLGLATRVAARRARAVVLMPSAHCLEARRALPASIPVIQFLPGVDLDFYRAPSDISDVPEKYRKLAQTLTRGPYVIMHGDQQRLNQDAVRFVGQSGIPLVRVCQGTDPEILKDLRGRIRKKGLQDRMFIFEKASYRFMRFLIQHAAAYAGMVDSTWQPAGWHTTLEAMACGIPVALYEGLVSDELKKLGAGESFLKVVPHRDTRAFQKSVESLVSGDRRLFRPALTFFTDSHFDLQRSAERFAERVEALCA
jgi:glycosyltransferase involved in cell wall biosynthesis